MPDDANSLDGGHSSSGDADSLHIAFKAPLFTETDPTRWFKLCESSFILSKINNNSTKFHHALTSLPSSVSSKLSDAVIDSNDYECLKNAVVTLYEQTKPELFDSLVSKNNIMCNKPSLYMRELQKLGSQLGLSDELIKLKFLKSLPSHMRSCISVHENKSLDEISAIADGYFAYGSPFGDTTCNIMPKAFPAENITNSNHQSFNSSMQQMPNSFQPNFNQFYPFNVPNNAGPQFSDCFAVSRNPGSSYQRPRTDYSSEGIPFGVRSFHPKQRPKFCRFHLYYGEKAKSCRPFCMFSKTHPNVLSLSANNSRNNSPSNSRSSSPTPFNQSGNA